MKLLYPDICDLDAIIEEATLVNSTPLADRRALVLRHLDLCVSSPRLAYQGVDWELNVEDKVLAGVAGLALADRGGRLVCAC